MSIRVAYIQRKVLEIYQSMDRLEYPIYAEEIIIHTPIPCKFMDYIEMSSINHCSIQDVIQMCGSEDGATIIDKRNHRGLVIYNSEKPRGRILWTQMHELGHLILNHPDLANFDELSCGDRNLKSRQFESEADYFVWNMLAPLPIMREMGIERDWQIEGCFGLSEQASIIHMKRYRKWCAGHIHTAWENDMIQVFRHKWAAYQKK